MMKKLANQKSSNQKKYGKKPFKGGKRKKRPKIPAEVKALANEHGIPIYTAFSVYREKASLEEVLAQKEVKEERKIAAQKICDEYPNINFALACSLVKDNVSPEKFFAEQQERVKTKREKELKKKDRMRQDNDQTLAFEELSRYCKEQVKITMMKYGGIAQEGTIDDFTPYDFYFRCGKKQETIHRLEMKYIVETALHGAIQRFIIVDKAILKQKLRPSHGPEGRFTFPDVALEKGAELMLALHEGEMIRGVVEWSTPYDIMLKIGKGRAWIFRHAVKDCMVMRRPQK